MYYIYIKSIYCILTGFVGFRFYYIYKCYMYHIIHTYIHQKSITIY